jgi:phenylalanine-4-hydroxylase
VPSTVARIELPAEHPGAGDPSYLERRAAIAASADDYREDHAIPAVAYTAEEDQVWRSVSRELSRLHARFAVGAYLDGAARLDLPRNRVPQLWEVDERLARLTDFHLQPVGGLVPVRTFYSALARRRFLSTQYVRHPSTPFYTPEPDIIHEIVGHANMLASRDLADLYQKAGRASLRAGDDGALDFFSRVFWFTLEFGVVWEAGQLRAYGAGLLSSYGEIQVFRDAEIRRFDIRAMGTQHYDITSYQPVLFAAESFPSMLADLGSFFDTFGTGDG